MFGSMMSELAKRGGKAFKKGGDKLTVNSGPGSGPNSPTDVLGSIANKGVAKLRGKRRKKADNSTATASDKSYTSGGKRL